MKIQQYAALPPVARPALPVAAPAVRAVDTVAISAAPSRLKRVAVGVARGALLGLPAAAVGYGISALGGLPGGIMGGVVGATMGFVSGRGLLEAARKLASSDPSRLNRAQKLAFKLGAMTPYVWALRSGITAAAAGSLLPPAATALMFGTRGAVAGSLFFGSK